MVLRIIIIILNLCADPIFRHIFVQNQFSRDESENGFSV
jgi:hypothetical protein